MGGGFAFRGRRRRPAGWRAAMPDARGARWLQVRSAGRMVNPSLGVVGTVMPHSFASTRDDRPRKAVEKHNPAPAPTSPTRLQHDLGNRAFGRLLIERRLSRQPTHTPPLPFEAKMGSKTPAPTSKLLSDTDREVIAKQPC